MKKIMSALLLSALLVSAATGCQSLSAKESVTAASASADKYAAWLTDKIGDSLGEVVICDGDDAADYGLDLSGLSEG